MGTRRRSRDDRDPDGGRGRGRGDGDAGRVPDGDDVLGGDVVGSALDRWLVAVRSDEAAATRARQRWLALQADADATLVGVLADLADDGGAVSVEVTGARLIGQVRVVGADFVVVADHDGADHLIRHDAIATVGRVGAATPVPGDRGPIVDETLIAALAAMVGDRPLVRCRVGGRLVVGELLQVGTDVLRLRPDGPEPAPVWVPVDALDWVAVLER